VFQHLKQTAKKISLRRAHDFRNDIVDVYPCIDQPDWHFVRSGRAVGAAGVEATRWLDGNLSGNYGFDERHGLFLSFSQASAVPYYRRGVIARSRGDDCGAVCKEHAGFWRRAYVISAMIAFYLNVFVLIFQAFLKQPALQALAPTQSEPPFLITQVSVMILFIVLTVFAVKRFRA
jgi:hypothetical protein